MSADTELANKNNSSIFFFGFVEVPVILVWAYIILKLFIVDIDVVIVQAFLPDYLWVLDYKFFAFVGLLAAWLAFGKQKSAILLIGFFLFYPLIILLWRIPKFIFGRKSWILAFSAVHFAISFIRSFRKNAICAAILLITSMVCLVANNAPPLWIAATILLLLVLYLYWDAARSVFKSPDVYVVYQSMMPKVSNYVISQNKLDPILKAIPASQRTEVQQKEWATKLDAPLLTNRIYLFLGRRFAEYQRSPAPYMSSLFQIAFLFFVTVISFALINYATYKIDPRNYESISTNGFSFFWYSFNVILFNVVKELSPATPLSQSIWMIEAFLVIFLIAIFAGQLFSIKTQRNSADLEKVVSTMEKEGRELEAYMQSEYAIVSVEDAISELERLKSGLFQVLIWLTKNIK